MLINQIEIDCATIELLPSGIIKVCYKPDYEVELKDAKEVEKVFISLSGENDMYCLMDMLGRFNMYTNEAQKYMSNEAIIVTKKRIKATAVIIDNLPNRLLTKFFIRIFNPQFLTQIFSNTLQAEKWLLEVKERNEKQGI